MKSDLTQLTVYRNLLKDPIVRALHKNKLKTAKFQAKLAEIAEREGFSGCIIEKYLFKLIAQDENVFTKLADHNLPIGESLRALVYQDSQIIIQFIKQLYSDLKDDAFYAAYQPGTIIDNVLVREISKAMVLTGDEQTTVERMIGYYKTYSCGLMSEYGAFVWRRDSGLTGVQNANLSGFDFLVGYEAQKNSLKQNTRAFLENRPANNVLLYGDRGTGKSSSIKALIPEYKNQGLRLVEIFKNDFDQLPEIMVTLSKHGCKFILVLDDLSFEPFEIEYKQLKSYIEGALEQRPNNVLIYATSNRRNLINETWAEQSGEEIHVRDSINERTSLVDRFGLKIYYDSPSQEEYFTIVEFLSQGLTTLSKDELRAQALKWQMRSSGRNGRTARSFINHLLGEVNE